MRPLILRPPQIPMTDFLLHNKRCALWAGMGIGKSSATLFVLSLLKLLGETDGPVLVIGPMRVARDTWPEEVTKWEQFKDLRIVALTGTHNERCRKLASRADIFTVSYEMLPWLVEQYLEKWPFRTVIADESDRLKGFREKKGGVQVSTKKAGHAGKRAHAIGRVAHNLTDRWINLTGTPSQTEPKTCGAKLGSSIVASVLGARIAPSSSVGSNASGADTARNRCPTAIRKFTPRWQTFA